MGDPDDLIAKAEKKLQGGGFLKGLFGGPKFEDARELYHQAANAFKLRKDWQKASEAFLRCAFCAQKAQCSDDEASAYQNAGDCLKKINVEEAIEQYEKTVKLMKDAGKFSQSAKLLKSMAELKEQDGVKDDADRAAVADLYLRAADMFDMDEFGKSSYSACMLKVADARAYGKTPPDYQEAIRIFEEQASKALLNNLLQYGAKDHLLKAGILQMCLNDSVTTSIARDKYFAMDPRFESSREGQLFAALAEAVETGSVEQFEEKLFEYDQISKLDSWKTTFLLEVKSQMAPSAGGGGVDCLDSDDPLGGLI